MPTTPQRKNPAILTRDMRTKFEQRTNITSYAADSKSRAMLDLMAYQQTDMANQRAAALDARDLASANGNDLDEIGVQLRLPRMSEQFCVANAVDRTLSFSVPVGTFGDLNSGQPFPIPVGSVIWSNPKQNENGQLIEYVVTQEAICQPAETQVFVSVRARNAGASHRVGPGVLVNHNVSTFSVPGTLNVINYRSILNGRDRESDGAYRYRLANRYDSILATNEAKITLASLEVGGVIDVRVVSGYAGPGTAAVVVLGADYNTNETMINGVQTRINEISGPASRVFAIPAVTVLFDLEIEVDGVGDLTEFDKANIRTNLRQVVRNYFRTIQIGGVVSLSRLAKEMQSSVDNRIQLKNTRSTQEIFKNVFIRKAFEGGFEADREKFIQETLVLDTIEYSELGTINIVIN